MSHSNGSSGSGKTYEVVFAGRSVKTALRWLHRGTAQDGKRPVLANIAGCTDTSGRTMLVTTDGFKMHVVRAAGDAGGPTGLDFGRERIINVGDRMPSNRPEPFPVQVVSPGSPFPNFFGVFPHVKEEMVQVAQITLDPAFLYDTLSEFDGMVTLALYASKEQVRQCLVDAEQVVVAEAPLEITGKLKGDDGYEAYAIIMPKYMAARPVEVNNWRPRVATYPPGVFVPEDEQGAEAVVTEPDEEGYEPDAGDLDPDEGDDPLRDDYFSALVDLQDDAVERDLELEVAPF